MEVVTWGSDTASSIALFTPPPPAVAPPRVRRPARVLLTGLALGALSDTLIYGQRIGIGFALFVAACVAALITVGLSERVEADNATAIRWREVVPLAIGLFFFAAMAAMRTDALLTAMNVAVCLRLGSLLVRCLRGVDAFAELTMRDFFFGGARTLFSAVVSVGPVLGAVQSELPSRGRSAQIGRATFRGLLWSVVPLIVFVALLSSADARFATVVQRVGVWFLPVDFAVRLWRAVLVGIVALLATGALAVAVTRRAASERASNTADHAAPRGVMGFGEAMIVLCSVCTVFGTFVAVQFVAFGGAGQGAGSVPEQARSGFYELVWAAGLVLTLISGLRSVARIETSGRKQNAFRAAATLLVGLTLAVLLSAIQRMAAFEDAYGATPKRLAVDMFIAFLSFALLWRVATLFVLVRLPTFAAGLMLCALGYCAAIDIQVPEAATIRVNMDRYRASNRLDEMQLTQVPTDDAVPALCDAFETTAPGTALHDDIGAALRQKRKEMGEAAQREGWPSFNLSRARASACLDRLEKK